MQRALEKQRGKPGHLPCQELFRKIGTGNGGTHPEPEEILGIRSLFGPKKVFSISGINSLHVRHLQKVHGRTDTFYWRWVMSYKDFLNKFH